MNFIYKQIGETLEESDNNSEFPFAYSLLFKDRDYTTIKLPLVKLYFYNSGDKKMTVMKAWNVKIRIFNKNWYQIGKHLIVKNLDEF